MAVDNLDLKINVDIVTSNTERLEKERQEFERLNAEILSVARNAKAAASAISSVGRVRSPRSSGASDDAKAGRDALELDRQRYAELRKRWSFERRMSAQQRSEEADAARLLREQQRETERNFRAQIRFNSQIAAQRARAESEAEKAIRDEIQATTRMRDRANRQALAETRRLEREQAKAAAAVARGAGQVRAGAGRAVAVGGAAAGVVGYAAKRGLDALTRSGVSIDAAINSNTRLSNLSPKDADAKGAEIRKRSMPIARSLGIKTSEYLKARAEAIQAGVEDELVDTVTEFGSKYARLNDIAPSEVMESSGYGITALGAFGKVTKDRIERLFNVEQHLAATTAASRQGLNAFVRRGLSAGAAAGFSVDDTLAYGGAATSSGADGESAARMLSSTTERLASLPTRAAGIARRKHKTPHDRLFLALPKRLGFNSWAEVKAAFSKDSAGTIEKIYEGLASIQDPRERLEMSEAVWGKEFGSVHAAMAVGHRFRDMRKSVRSRDVGNAIDSGMSVRSGSFDFIMDQIGSTVQDLKDGLGLVLKPLWSDLRDWAMKAPEAFSQFENAFRMGMRGFMQGLGSQDGTMSGLLRNIFGDPGNFKIDAYRIGDFARGFGQGLRDVGGAISSFIRLFAGQNASAAELGKWTARILGFSAALIVAAPAIAVLTGLGTAISGLVGVMLGAWRLLKAAGMVGATGAGANPKVPASPGAVAAEGWMARFGRLLGIGAFTPTAGLSKPDQDKLIGRLGAYAQKLEQDKASGGHWVDLPIRKPIQELKESLDKARETLEEGAKVQKQSFEALEDANFQSLIHKASFNTPGSSLNETMRSTAARAASPFSGSVGGGSGPLLNHSVPGGSLGNGLVGMRRRGIMGGGGGGDVSAGGGLGNSVAGPRDRGDVAARARQAYDYFVSRGYSPQAASGIIASLKAESNFTPTSRGDGGAAHGIAQWHRDRRAQILTGAGINVSNASFADQLKAVDWEMRSGDAGAQRARRGLMQPGVSAREAGAIFVKNFERPKADERAKRGAIAEGYHRQFGAGTAAPSPVEAAQQSVQALRDRGAAAGSGYKPPSPAASPKPNLVDLDVTPPSRGNGLGQNTPMRSGSGASGSRGGHAGGGGTVTNNITVHAANHSPDEMANSVQRAINQDMGRRTHDFDQSWG